MKINCYSVQAAYQATVCVCQRYATPKNIGVATGILAGLVAVGGIIYYQRQKVWKQVPTSLSAAKILQSYPKYENNEVIVMAFKEEYEPISAAAQLALGWTARLSEMRKLLDCLKAKKPITYSQAKIVIHHQVLKDHLIEQVKFKIADSTRDLLGSTHRLLQDLRADIRMLSSLNGLMCTLSSQTAYKVFEIARRVQTFWVIAQAMHAYCQVGFDKIEVDPEASKITIPFNDEAKSIDLKDDLALMAEVISIQTAFNNLRNGVSIEENLVLVLRASECMERLRSKLSIVNRILKAVKKWIESSLSDLTNYVKGIASDPVRRMAVVQYVTVQASTWALETLAIRLGSDLTNMPLETFANDFEAMRTYEEINNNS